MLKKLGILALGAALALVASSAITWGDSNSKTPVRAKTFEQRIGHPVSSPTTPVAGKTAKKPRLKYFETRNFTIPGSDRDDSFMLCPRKYKAINGYFGSNGLIFADFSASGNPLRRWNFGLAETTGAPGRAFLGIVCLKGTR
jgi:hypothetical protein